MIVRRECVHPMFFVNSWTFVAFSVLFTTLVLGNVSDTPNDSGLWARWWTYRGISGPKYWGLLNARWRLCSDGRRQSPINIEPKRLLYDPTLKDVHVSPGKVNGIFVNTGVDVSINVINNASNPIYVTLGPLSYRYKVFQLRLHFSGNTRLGSEHKVNNHSFPAELQILAYNDDLYANSSEAETSPHGLVAIAVFMQIGNESHAAFNTIARSLEQVRIKGRQTKLHAINTARLLPETSHYVTYEGSQTQPACHETVTWVVMNKPIYISTKQLNMIRSINHGSGESTQIIMERNVRPLQHLNGRSVRTNIHLTKECKHKASMFYQVLASHTK